VAGAGKSVLLRRLASEVAKNTLSEASNELLPVLFPIGRFEVSGAAQWIAAAQNPAAARDACVTILGDWSRWVDSLVVDDLIPDLPRTLRSVRLTQGWLRRRLHRGSVLLIFDGLDEFLERHGLDGVSVFRVLCAWLNLGDLEYPNGNVVVASCRSSMPGIRELSEHCTDVLSLEPLSVVDAETIAPGIQELLGRLDDPEMNNVLLTPLIATRLSKALSIGDPRLLNHRGVMEIAVRELFSTGNGNGSPEQLRLLALVAWVAFRSSMPTLSLDELVVQVSAVAAEWRQYLKERVQCTTDTAPIANCSRDELQLLLSHTAVFVQTGKATYAFAHQKIEQSLAATYIADAIKAGFVDELRYRAFTGPQYRDVWQELSELTIDSNYVDQVSERSKRFSDLQRRFIIGNYVALLCTGRARVTPAGIEALSHLMTTSDEYARYVCLARLCERGLADLPGDESSRDLRRHMTTVVENLVAQPGEVDPLTRSVASCYALALYDRFGLGSGNFQSSPLTMGESGRIVHWIKSSGNSGSELSLHDRSLQVAYIGSLQRVPIWRAITVVHYLYLLVVAWKNNLHIPEARRALQDAFAPKSACELAMTSCGMRGVRELYEHCRHVFLSSEKFQWPVH
jgi:hypothetical protein